MVPLQALILRVLPQNRTEGCGVVPSEGRVLHMPFTVNLHEYIGLFVNFVSLAFLLESADPMPRGLLRSLQGMTLHAVKYS